MSNHLFPAKTEILLTTLKSLSIYKKLIKETKDLSVVMKNDGQDRIALVMPSIYHYVEQDYNIKNARIRLVIPQNISLSINKNKIFEIYNTTTNNIIEKDIDSLSRELALAVENELHHIIAKSYHPNLNLS